MITSFKMPSIGFYIRCSVCDGASLCEAIPRSKPHNVMASGERRNPLKQPDFELSLIMYIKGFRDTVWTFALQEVKLATRAELSQQVLAQPVIYNALLALRERP